MVNRDFLEKLALVGEQALKKAGVDFKVDPKSISEILGENIKERNDEKKPTAENLAKELSALSGFGTPNEISTIFERTFSELGLKTEEEKTEFLQAVVENIAKVHPQFEWGKIEKAWQLASQKGKSKTSFSEFVLKSIAVGLKSVKPVEASSRIGETQSATEAGQDLALSESEGYITSDDFDRALELALTTGSISTKSLQEIGLSIMPALEVINALILAGVIEDGYGDEGHKVILSKVEQDVKLTELRKSKNILAPEDQVTGERELSDELYIRALKFVKDNGAPTVPSSLLIQNLNISMWLAYDIISRMEKEGLVQMQGDFGSRVAKVNTAIFNQTVEKLTAENGVKDAEKEVLKPVVEIFKDVEVTEVKTAIGQVVFYTNKGIGYKDYNEDRIVINTEKNGFAVIDGMGGMGNGEEAAEILAEQIQKGFLNNTPYEQVQELAHVEMFNKGVGRGGACYVSARVDQEGIMHGAMAGDVRLIVVNIKGEVVFETKDEGVGLSVFNVVQGTEPGNTTKFSYKLEKGYKVLIFSDGVSDNFDEAEDDFKEKKQGSQNIADFLNGKTLKEAVEELKSRQEEKVTIFTNKKKELKELFNLKSVSQKTINDYNDEVAKLEGKPDNVALVAFEYSGEGNTAETKERAYEWNAEVMDALDQKKHPVILEYKEMLFGDFAKSLESPNIVLNTEKARDAFLLWWEAGGKYNEINAMKEEGLLEDWQEFLNSPGVNKE